MSGSRPCVSGQIGVQAEALSTAGTLTTSATPPACWRPAALPARLSRLPARWTACALAAPGARTASGSAGALLRWSLRRSGCWRPAGPAAVHWLAAAALHCAGRAPRMSAARPSARGLPLRPARAAQTVTCCSSRSSLSTRLPWPMTAGRTRVSWATTRSWPMPRWRARERRCMRSVDGRSAGTTAALARAPAATR